jgi:hypothetical protein
MNRIDRSLPVAALAGWAGCAAVMGIGQAATTKDNALVIHAVAAPIILFVVSWVYFTRTGSQRVLFTACFFTVSAMAIDFFLVALLFMRSLEMFTSLIGTWIPFGLIFASTYLTGRLVSARRRSPRAQPSDTRPELAAAAD